MLKTLGAAVIGLCLISTTVFAQVAAPTPVKPTDAQGWRALVIEDLNAMRAQLTANTPVPFDSVNPAYPRWLEDGHRIALSRAEQVRDENSHLFALLGYANGFNDPHINVSATTPLAPLKWPGFVAAAKGDGAVVVHVDANDAAAPPSGAVISECDGADLRTLARERLYPFLLNGAIAVDQRRAMARLFADRPNPFAPTPRTCVFEHAGKRETRTLVWRDTPTDGSFLTAFVNASNGPTAPWGVSEPAAGVTWIGIPTFQSGEDTAPKLDQLILDIEARGDAMRQGRAIIIDTRGNGGGNSAWAMRIANAIFTPPVIARLLQRKTRSAVDWRASPDNIAFWRTWSGRMGQEFGADSPSKRSADATVTELTAALDDRPPIWRQGPRRVGAGGGLTLQRAQENITAMPGPFPAKVYFLSNGSCGSSCLNFADVVLFVPGVTLIGSATHADGPYMEVRDVVLPSGLFRLTLPQKVWRGMGRGPLEAYQPDIAYDGAWDDASVRAWVMDLVAHNGGAR